MGINRRAFLGSMVAVAAARVVRAQLPAETANLWGSPVIDCHFHPRPTLEANLAHLNGSGCQAAYMLARLTAADDAKRFMAQEPTRFAGYSVSTDVSAPDAVKLLTKAVKAGAHGFGEVKFHVEADGPCTKLSDPPIRKITRNSHPCRRHGPANIRPSWSLCMKTPWCRRHHCGWYR